MRKLLKIMSSLMILVMLFSALNLQVIAAENEKEKELLSIAKKGFENLSPEAKQKFVTFMEQEESEGNTELINFHKKNIDQKYKKNTSIKIQSASSVVTMGVASTATSSTNSLTTLNNALIALSLPLAVRYTLVAVGGAVAVSQVPIAGQIIDAFVAVGAISILVCYWDQISSKWTGIVNAFKLAFSSVANAVTSAFDRIVLKVRVEDAISKVTAEIKKYKYPICFYNATIIPQVRVDVYKSQGDIGVAGAVAKVMLNSGYSNIYCSDAYIAKFFATVMSFGSRDIPRPDDKPGEGQHYHATSPLTKNSHIFYGNNQYTFFK